MPLYGNGQLPKPTSSGTIINEKETGSQATNDTNNNTHAANYYPYHSYNSTYINYNNSYQQYPEGYNNNNTNNTGYSVANSFTQNNSGPAISGYYAPQYGGVNHHPYYDGYSNNVTYNNTYPQPSIQQPSLPPQLPDYSDIYVTKVSDNVSNKKPTKNNNQSKKKSITQKTTNDKRKIPDTNKKNLSDTNKRKLSDTENINNDSSTSGDDDTSSSDEQATTLHSDDSDTNKPITVPGTSISLQTDEDIANWRNERRKMWLIKISNNKEEHMKRMGIKPEDVQKLNSVLRETKKEKQFIQNIQNQVKRFNPNVNLNNKIIQRDMESDNLKILQFIKELGDAKLLDCELTEAEKNILFGGKDDKRFNNNNNSSNNRFKNRRLNNSNKRFRGNNRDRSG